MKTFSDENGTVLAQKLRCVLLVDDDEATNFIHKTWFRIKGIAQEVITVNNGQKAIDYISRQSGVQRLTQPEVILLDINMPVMDGWEFLAAFRELPDAFKRSYIYMLTSSPNPQDEQRALRIPEVTGFMRKPISKEMITGFMNTTPCL